MLDAVIADARRLQMRLGTRDRQRLEFHLEGILTPKPIERIDH